MILLTPIPEVEQTTAPCPHCEEVATIPYVSLVDTLSKLRSLLDGTMNTATCNACGMLVTAQEPVGMDLEKYGIEDLLFLPLAYIERGCYPADLLKDPDEARRFFYSLDELARQVRARIIIHQLRLGL